MRHAAPRPAGDRPFAFSDGTCDFCRAGLQTSCRTGGYWGGAANDGGQGEAVRAPLADGTLVPMPDDADLSDDRLARSLATLTDVMGTGHHGALASGIGAGGTAVVVGDGAVGLCAVLAARRLRRRARDRPRPPRRPAGDRARLRRDRRRRGARRRGRRAGARAHRRRLVARDRVRRHGRLVRHGHRQRPAGRDGRPRGRAGRAGQPARRPHAQRAADRRGRARARPTSPS